MRPIAIVLKLDESGIWPHRHELRRDHAISLFFTQTNTLVNDVELWLAITAGNHRNSVAIDHYLILRGIPVMSLIGMSGPNQPEILPDWFTQREGGCYREYIFTLRRRWWRELCYAARRRWQRATDTNTTRHQ